MLCILLEQLATCSMRYTVRVLCWTCITGNCLVQAMTWPVLPEVTLEWVYQFFALVPTTAGIDKHKKRLLVFPDLWLLLLVTLHHNDSFSNTTIKQCQNLMCVLDTRHEIGPRTHTEKRFNVAYVNVWQDLYWVVTIRNDSRANIPCLFRVLKLNK